MTNITIKASVGDELRRFCVPETISFADFVNNLKKLCNSRGELSIKYIDDEGDWIVVTSAEELREAFRMAKESKPPLLRVNLQVKEVAPELPNLVGTQTSLPEIAIPNNYPPLDVAFWDAPAKIKKEEGLPESAIPNEYPPLDVAFWDVPPKKAEIAQPISLVAIAPEQPLRIAVQTANYCTSTLHSVLKCSADIAKETQKHSDQIRVQLHDSGLASSTALLCSDLSRKIAEECRALSLETVELSKQLAAQRKNDISVADADALFKASLK